MALSDAARQKKKDYMRKYRQENRDRINEKMREWRRRNPEKVRQTREKYWENIVIREEVVQNEQKQN